MNDFYAKDKKEVISAIDKEINKQHSERDMYIYLRKTLIGLMEKKPKMRMGNKGIETFMNALNEGDRLFKPYGKKLCLPLAKTVDIQEVTDGWPTLCLTVVFRPTIEETLEEWDTAIKHLGSQIRQCEDAKENYEKYYGQYCRMIEETEKLAEKYGKLQDELMFTIPFTLRRMFASPMSLFTYHNLV